MFFSFIIPVFNRPDEIKELLESFLSQDYKQEYEIVIIEDGSTIKCEDVIALFSNNLQITYLSKSNTGPGDSRNYGMERAKGDYFIILDSDCVLPENYLSTVENSLQTNFVDCFGGPDTALASFSALQKAINFTMTAFITTGGIRGGSEKLDKFQPRSFNMGLSKTAFLATKGFGTIHPGEDPDLSIRLWKLGYETRLFKEAFVFHKRRIDWSKFYNQVHKFGKARPILDLWYPEYKKLTFLFPTLFVFGLDLAIILLLFGLYFPFYLYLIYFSLVFFVATLQTSSLKIGFYAIMATIIQFYGYGYGYLKAFLLIHVLKKEPKKVFPELFYD